MELPRLEADHPAADDPVHAADPYIALRIRVDEVHAPPRRGWNGLPDQHRIGQVANDADTGGVAWAEAYERDFAVEGMFDLQTEIAREIVRRIAQPQGAIALFDWKRTRGKAPETWDAYDCVIQADDLRRRVLPPALAPEVRACLQRAVEQEPGYADAWVMSALIEIDALRFTPRIPNSSDVFRP